MTKDTDLARLLVDLARLGGLAPELVASEVRPLVSALTERERVCDLRACRRRYLMKQLHRRPRGFCSDECRVAASRKIENGASA